MCSVGRRLGSQQMLLMDSVLGCHPLPLRAGHSRQLQAILQCQCSLLLGKSELVL